MRKSQSVPTVRSNSTQPNDVYNLKVNENIRGQANPDRTPNAASNTVYAAKAVPTSICTGDFEDFKHERNAQRKGIEKAKVLLPKGFSKYIEAYGQGQDNIDLDEWDSDSDIEILDHLSLSVRSLDQASDQVNVKIINDQSPSAKDTSKDFTEPIDKVRDDSINDLMATIAKVDSNGVQVLPEGRNKTTSPQVHSSADIANVAEEKADQKDDPNEDWCAVCLDGGELMYCDKYPKVFHQNCHIPAISSLPDESGTWQGLLCVNLAELASSAECERHNAGELGANELKIIQRIRFELLVYWQYEQSLPFREPEPATHTAYYEIICHPMSLDAIRTRLDPSSPSHYKDIATFVADVRLLAKTVYLYYPEDSKTYAHARYLEQFFEEQLAKWLPKYALVNKCETNADEYPVKKMRKNSE